MLITENEKRKFLESTRIFSSPRPSEDVKRSEYKFDSWRAYFLSMMGTDRYTSQLNYSDAKSVTNTGSKNKLGNANTMARHLIFEYRIAKSRLL